MLESGAALFSLAFSDPADPMFEIPLSQIDPQTWPPPLYTSVAGSFAHNTLQVRVPRLLRETIELNSFEAGINRALEDLYDEIVSGQIRELRGSTPDQNFWNEVSRDYFGRSWLDVPWYWAETYFYRRVLEATRFFVNDIDPYAVFKAREWEANSAPRLADLILTEAPHELIARFRFLLYASLWGNRADLSYAVGTRFGHLGNAADDLLVDNSECVWEHINTRRPARIAIIADNTGLEQLLDFALVDCFLSESLTQSVDYHLKPQPFFVSDTMPRDIEPALVALERGSPALRELAGRIRGYLADARLVLKTHWYYPTCLFYYQLPEDLFADLRSADLVILKGDANYRRLLGDARWNPTASFVQATAYFPAPFVSLRTLKAEIITGLRPGQAEQLDAVDPQWRVNGRRGVVQGRLNSRT